MLQLNCFRDKQCLPVVVSEIGKGRDQFETTPTSSTTTLVKVKLVPNVDFHQRSRLQEQKKKHQKIMENFKQVND